MNQPIDDTCDSVKIRVLVIHESSLMRDLLTSLLNSDSSIEVVGGVQDDKEGLDKILELKPDVIIMNIDTPVTNGFEAIKRIMERCPVSILIVSSTDLKELEKCLSVGAMDYVWVAQNIEEVAGELFEKVKIASRVKPLKQVKIKTRTVPELTGGKKASKIITIGVSTGGPQALQSVLSSLPVDLNAGILVVQHMSKGFIGGLIEWLRFFTPLDIRIAMNGDLLTPATILFSPDDQHVEIDDNYSIRLFKETNKTTVYMPSVDVMMKSAAELYKENAIGLIMTGMGSDGADGICAIKKAGGMTIAQDEKTSKIFGMNKEAIETGCVDTILPLERITNELIRMVNSNNGQVSNKKILIIDDSPTSLDIMRERLAEEGYETILAETGEEGVEKTKEVNPKLVIIDTLLPGIDGFETCIKIKQIQQVPSPKIILMTGSAHALNAAKAREAGADVYCVKTYDCSMLLEEVKKIFG